jgi:uncharacterized protein YfaS (alpha-2-macroglobulin family)
MPVRSVLAGTRFVGLLCLVLVSACQCQPPKPATTAPDASGMTSAADAGAPAEELDGPPTSLDQLAPIIRHVSIGGAAPAKVVIQLSRRVGKAGQPLASGTELSVEPPLAQGHTARWASTSSIEIVPNDRRTFRNGTKYEVTLSALGLGDTVLRGEREYRHNFDTPRFMLARVGFAGFDEKKKVAELDVVFTGAVDAKKVKSRLTTQVGPTPARLTLAATDRPNVLRASVRHPGLAEGRTIVVNLAEGVPSAQDPDIKAPADSDHVEIPEGETVEILEAHPAEGARGFFIHVICSDEAGGDWESYFWDSHVGRSFDPVGRCVLDERAVRGGIHFEPAVDNVSVSAARGGFQITGDFTRGSYSMRIDAGVRSVDGARLSRTFEVGLTVPARTPSVRFVAQGRYLPRSAWRSLAVQHVNVDKVDVMIRHVPPENLVFWMSGSENADERTSEVIARRKVAVRGEADKARTSWLDLVDMVPATTKGLIEVSVGGKRAPWDSRRLVLTDTNLIAKLGAEQVVVWAFGIHKNNALNGAQIELITQSGHVIDDCRTTVDGGCTLELGDQSGPLSRHPYAIVARNGSDLTYLKFADLRNEVSEHDVSGVAWGGGGAKYRAAAWSDRGVYRPGEVAHVAAVVRGQNDRAPKKGLPVQLQLLDPRDQVTERRVLETNEGGVITADLKFSDFATTGKWYARFLVGKHEIGRYGFHVEEFVPERMKVEAKAAGAAFHVADEVPIDVSARYLFGGSAEGSRFELSCDLMPSRFRPKEHKEFTFDVWYPDDRAPRAMSLGQVDGELEEDGVAQAACPAAEKGAGFAGPARVRAKAAVFEAGSGRSTVGDTSAPVHPERYYVGLKAGTDSAKAGEPVEVQGVVVDWDGKVLTSVDEVDVALYRVSYEYGWTYDEDEGSWGNRYHQRTTLDAEQSVKVNKGRFKVSLTPTQGASLFLVRATSGDARTDLSLTSRGYFYWWSHSWSSGGDQTPRPSRATSLDVRLPVQTSVGKPVTAKLTAPYPGRLLLTVETDRVVEHTFKDVKAGEVQHEFTVKKFAPNVYVSALLVKDPHLDSKKAFTPERAFGVRSMRVQPEEFVQTVGVDVPKEVRSNSKLVVKLDVSHTDEPTFVTVAAVDEGILQLTKFKSPDPLADIFAKRRLGVETYETVGWNLLLPAADAGAEHGGGADGDAGRVQPVKPVALWSGLLPVPKNGKLEVPFDVPQYRGQLRVMVVTASASRIGHADAKVLVRDPIVLQTTLPRFLMKGDTFDIPVFLSNVSGKSQDVQVTVKAEALDVGGDASLPATAPVQLLGAKVKRLSLADTKSGTTVFRAKTTGAVGAAKFTVTAKAGALVVHDELDVPINPDGPRVRRVKRMQVKGPSTDVKALLDKFVPTTERTTVTVTDSPWGDAFDHLSYLVRYPYGCIEQTTSSTRPLLFVERLVGSVDPGVLQGKQIEPMVMAGVNRILSMQTPAGGFGYWPGSSEPVFWGTAYATHMLLDARELKYPVPKSRLDEAIAWMKRELTHHIETASPGSRNFGRYRDAEPYFHYVLARAGKGRTARVEKLIKKLAKEPKTSRREESLYLLKAALWHAGDRRYERDLKDVDVSPIDGKRKNDWSFYSDRRRRGLTLTLFGEMFGADPAGAELADVVAEMLRGRESYWYTTQELVWGVTALARRMGAKGGGLSPGKLKVNGKERAPAVAPTAKPKDDTGQRTFEVYRATERKSVEVTVAKKDVGSAWLILSSEGVPVGEPWRSGSDGLRLERSYYTMEGDLVDLSDIALGDLVVTVVTIENTTGERVQNIALVDRLPAGFEIENPRLGRGGALDILEEEDLWTFDHMNVRDDRVEVFGALNRREERSFVYAARAVTAGTFSIPPVEAEAMYAPTIRARELGGEAVVHPPWADADEGDEP